jgi:hypothetical protein
MRWTRLFIVCYSSIILFGFAGCKKPIVINVDPSVGQLSAVVAPGDTLEWIATTAGESFDVVFDDSTLCTQKSPLHASYKNPAKCTIAPQTFVDKQPKSYTYNLVVKEDGKPLPSPKYNILVAPGHCRYCLLVGPGHCSYCRPPY